MLIHVIRPVTGKHLNEPSDYLDSMVSVGTTVSVVSIDDGPASIDSDFDIAMAAPGIIRRVQEAESADADAVVISCMADPALYAAREITRIPVVGPAQSSYALAATLTDRFSVLGTTSRDIPFTRDIWRRYGLTDCGVSVRPVGLEVLSLLDDEPDLLARLVKASTMAIEEDGAGALVFGCTLLCPYRDHLIKALAERGHGAVLVIDPLAVAMKVAEMLVQLGLRHSGVTWPPVTAVGTSKQLTQTS